MDCKNQHKGCCSTDMGRGCNFCNCGEEASASACEGCYKLHAEDWLEQMPNIYEDDIFEVRFKNTRKGYYKNANSLPLKSGDIVAVEASPGHDIGIVSLTGDMVTRQMKRVGFNPQNGEFKKIYRKAKPYDIEKWQEAIAMEHETMIRSRQIAADLKLNMKIGDVEYQGDKIKAIFYYIADERVDFRELIKIFAEQFRIRVEMKQIGARQEAGRIGGLGSCGRELCCASWISNFVSVTTNSARTQEISLNPQKLAGQCSKLKCCLIYELDTYLDARKEMPRVNQPLQAMDGEYYLVKSDILGRTMSFSSSPNAMVGVVTLPLTRVREILEINRRGKKVDKIELEPEVSAKPQEPVFVNAIGEESITRFDKKRDEQPRGKNNRGGQRDRSRTNGNGSGNGSERRQNSGERTPDQPRQNNGNGQNNNTEQRQGNGERRQNGENRGKQKRFKKPGTENNEGGNSTPSGEQRKPNPEARQGGGEGRQGDGEGRQGRGERGANRGPRGRDNRENRENRGGQRNDKPTPKE